MRKIIYLNVISCFIAINIHAQTVSRDHTFGQNGITVFQNSSEASLLDFDSEGNIIAAGYTIPRHYAESWDGRIALTLAKTDANGNIDTGFGNDGLSRINQYHTSYPVAMKTRKDNKIFIIAYCVEVQFEGAQHILMQFNEDGSMDDTFGDHGIIILNNGSQIAVNLESDDFMLIGQSTYYLEDGVYRPGDYLLSKLDYNGELIENFGENGKVNLNSFYAHNIKILNDNAIVVAGTCNIWPNAELGLCKVTPDGKIDTDFATDGLWHKTFTEQPYWKIEAFTQILEDNDGNLILSGSGHMACAGCFGSVSFISKFSANGIPDAGFGTDGFCFLDFTVGFVPVYQIGDKYVTACYAGNDTGNTIFVFVNKDGSFATKEYARSIYYFADMKLQGENKFILGGGYAMNNSFDNLALERVIVDTESFVKPIEHKNDPKIYPNPVKDILYFSEASTFEIFDMQGRTLIKSATPVNSFNISGLKAGFYLIRLGNTVQKFVKE